jgi:hypothetical protein
LTGRSASIFTRGLLAHHAELQEGRIHVESLAEAHLRRHAAQSSCKHLEEKLLYLAPLSLGETVLGGQVGLAPVVFAAVLTRVEPHPLVVLDAVGKEQDLREALEVGVLELLGLLRPLEVRDEQLQVGFLELAEVGPAMTVEGVVPIVEAHLVESKDRPKGPFIGQDREAL